MSGESAKARMMKNHIYRCELCSGEFESDWSDAEARQEYAKVFPGAAARQEHMSVVCDNCYQMMNAMRPMRRWDKEHS